MVVDIIWPGWVPFTQLGYAEDVPGYIQAHDDILAYDFDLLIAGHLNRPGTRQDVETQKAMSLRAIPPMRKRFKPYKPAPLISSSSAAG